VFKANLNSISTTCISWRDKYKNDTDVGYAIEAKHRIELTETTERLKALLSYDTI